MRIGVTGHQSLEQRLVQQGADHLEPEAWAWVARSFTQLLTEEAIVVSSLAAGADQRLAGIAVDHGLQFEAVIPSAGYESTFVTAAERQEYVRLLGLARKITTLEFSEPSEEAFFAAGKVIVDRSNLLVAVWDGQKAAGLGGTADIIAYGLDRHTSAIQLDPIRLTTRRWPEED